MDERTLRKVLSDIPLGGLRAFKQTGSTNNMALAWAADGATDLSMVYAEEQTSGRGRGDRRWITRSGTALAFSLILRPLPGEELSVPLFSGMGAVAVCDVLAKRGLLPEIKWPNDVLLNRRKVCGILAESVWIGEHVDSVILGIGVNVKPESVPLFEQLNFPATSLEAETGKSEDRLSLLRDILQALLFWRNLYAKEAFIHAWGNYLAYRGEQVEIQVNGEVSKTGKIEGLKADGNLILRLADETTFTVQFGEVHLRPVI